MDWLGYLDTWRVGSVAKPPGFLLEKQTVLLELTLSKGMTLISIWKHSQVWRMHTEMRNFGSSSLIYFNVFANKHKLSDLCKSLSVGIGIWNWISLRPKQRCVPGDVQTVLKSNIYWRSQFSLCYHGTSKGFVALSCCLLLFTLSP